MQLTPIALFVYNRPDHTQKTIDALMSNDLIHDSQIYIFSDNASMEQDKSLVQEVRTLIQSYQWIKEPLVIEREENFGLAANIVSGISQVLDIYDQVIVLEDDIITSKGFLQFMNEALALYKKDEEVMHISGYMFPLKRKLPETFFYNTASCWGWGTWARAWKYYNDDASFLAKSIDQNGLAKKFNINDSYDFYGDLVRNAKGEMRTWAVKWYASFFLKNGYALHPYPSLTHNIGHDGTGENSSSNNQFHWDTLAQKIEIKTVPIVESQDAISAMVDFYTKPVKIESLRSRLKTKLRNAPKKLLSFLNR